MCKTCDENIAYYHQHVNDLQFDNGSCFPCYQPRIDWQDLGLPETCPKCGTRLAEPQEYWEAFV